MTREWHGAPVSGMLNRKRQFSRGRSSSLRDRSTDDYLVSRHSTSVHSLMHPRDESINGGCCHWRRRNYHIHGAAARRLAIGSIHFRKMRGRDSISSRFALLIYVIYAPLMILSGKTILPSFPRRDKRIRRIFPDNPPCPGKFRDDMQKL